MSEQMVMGLNPTDDVDYNTNTPLFSNKDRIVNLVLQSYNLAKYVELQLNGSMLQMIGKKDKELISEVYLGINGKLTDIDFNSTTNTLIFYGVDDNGVPTEEIINLNELTLYQAGVGMKIEGLEEERKTISMKVAGQGYLTINSANQLDTSDLLQTILDNKLEHINGIGAIQTDYDSPNNSYDVMLSIDNAVDKGNIELTQTENGLSANIELNMSYNDENNTLSLFVGDSTTPSSEVVIGVDATPYTAGDGININNYLISSQIDDTLNESNYLKINTNGLYISGIDEQLIDINNKVGGVNVQLGILDNNINNVSTALNDKVDKVDGMGLSTNDFTNEEKLKLTNISFDNYPTKDDVDDEVLNLQTQINGKVDKSLYDIKINELENEINNGITEVFVGDGIIVDRIDNAINLSLKLDSSETNLVLSENGLSTNLPENLFSIISDIQTSQIGLVKSIEQLNNTISNQSIMINNLTKRVTTLEEKM